MLEQFGFHLGGNAGMLTPRLDWTYQGTIYQDANNNPYTAIKSRGLLDGRLTWDAPVGGLPSTSRITARATNA